MVKLHHDALQVLCGGFIVAGLLLAWLFFGMEESKDFRNFMFALAASCCFSAVFVSLGLFIIGCREQAGRAKEPKGR